MKAFLSGLLSALIFSGLAQAQTQELVCWEFASQPISCNGVDQGAEFGRDPSLSQIPTWVPDPLVIEQMNLSIYRFPSQTALPANVYGALAVNTDPGLEWFLAGCSPLIQTCPIERGVDLGRLFFGANGPFYATFQPKAPVVIDADDGLVMSQICYGGGQIQSIYDFCWIEQRP